ncbi:hypothetical protein SAY86_031340 [Trapa natans]|uniref:Transcription repressor n=1 Tax=Trapa natans TaxID=22666 RepID=A0AAN7M2Z5_TRANT|nr:hypothetical protein SAY86_031340 [Trapa natans]
MGSHELVCAIVEYAALSVYETVKQFHFQRKHHIPSPIPKPPLQVPGFHCRRNSFQSLPSKCRAASAIEPLSRSGPISIPKAPEDGASAFTVGDVLKGRLYRLAASLSSPLKNHARHPGSTGDTGATMKRRNETDTLFSSKSFVSSSFGSRQQWRLARWRSSRRKSRSEVGVLPMDSEDGNGIQGSFTVVKKSSDPYGDFRKSMEEKIMEKQIFGA